MLGRLLLSQHWARFQWNTSNALLCFITLTYLAVNLLLMQRI